MSKTSRERSISSSPKLLGGGLDSEKKIEEKKKSSNRSNPYLSFSVIIKELYSSNRIIKHFNRETASSHLLYDIIFWFHYTKCYLLINDGKPALPSLTSQHMNDKNKIQNMRFCNLSNNHFFFFPLRTFTSIKMKPNDTVTMNKRFSYSISKAICLKDFYRLDLNSTQMALWWVLHKSLNIHK